MKRVSFQVAKAIKEAGYPQGYHKCDFIYYGKSLISEEKYYSEFRSDTECFSAPLYLEVWLWLVREKNILLRVAMTTEDWEEKCWNCYCRNPYILLEKPDPEEVIIAGIEYLVDNNLIK